jgi:DNA repair protein RadC
MQRSFFQHEDAKLSYLPPREHPGRRVAEQPHGCNLVELFATLIGGPRQVETAEALLRHFKTLTALHQAHTEEIATFVPGVGRTTAARLVAALELGYRLTVEPLDERPVIYSPADAAALIQIEMGVFEQEHLRVMYLNTRNRVLGWEDVYKGSLNSAQVRVGELFKGPIRRNASAVILAHNHPSQDPTPSPDDVAITRAIVQAGKLLDIEILDHLIVCKGDFVSMKQRGLGFS